MITQPPRALEQVLEKVLPDGHGNAWVHREVGVVPAKLVPL